MPSGNVRLIRFRVRSAERLPSFAGPIEVLFIHLPQCRVPGR